MNLSLFQAPGTIAFLDDDPSYLDMLAMVLPRHWHARFFLRPQSCIHHLQQDIAQWDDDLWLQQQIVSRWQEGNAALVPQILDYWSRTDRYALTRICVVDYSMPAMNGLQVLEKLEDWRGSRLLLTGQADEQIAVKAFNYGLIEHFLPKQTPNISQRLMDAIQRLQGSTSNRQSPLWRATLNQRQFTLLRSPSISPALADIVSKRWMEHVVIGSPFGIIGRDTQGNTSWLQLEPSSGLDELAELAESVGMDATTVGEIQLGTRLPNLELTQTLGQADEPELSQAFSIGEDEPLLGAFFDVKTDANQRSASSYAQWLADQPARNVEG